MPETTYTALAGPPTMEPVPAYILAGGASSRFGADKARADVSGTPLIRRIADGLAGVCVSVSAVAQSSDAFDDLGLRTIADAAPGCGPVQGLLTALTDTAQSHEPGWAMLAACDMLPRDAAMYTVLLAECRALPGDRRALACRTDRWHPMPGLYHTDLIPHLAAYLADGGRSFQGFLARASSAAAVATSACDRLGDILHVTTPHDLPGGLRLT